MRALQRDAREAFQYPLRVEVGCNLRPSPRRPTTSIVSVPSTGRSGLQLLAWMDHRRRRERFSTLYGSKWVATSWRDELAHKVSRFSTLYGSKWVATLNCAFRTDHFNVSVPSTGRSGLQPNTGVPSAVLRTVSVPSTGRSGLQHLDCRHYFVLDSCFSTLYGSKWVATDYHYPARCGEVGFQYPLRVEVGCNKPCICSGE